MLRVFVTLRPKVLWAMLVKAFGPLMRERLAAAKVKSPYRCAIWPLTVTLEAGTAVTPLTVSAPVRLILVSWLRASTPKVWFRALLARVRRFPAAS